MIRYALALVFTAAWLGAAWWLGVLELPGARLVVVVLLGVELYVLWRTRR